MVTADVTREGTKKIAKTKEFDIEYYEAGTGHPVIMLHGTGPGATGWSNFYPNLGPLSKNFRAIAMTFPGWGAIWIAFSMAAAATTARASGGT